MIDLAWNIDHPALIVGLVVADDVTVAPMSADGTAAMLARVNAAGDPPEATRAAIRKLLKHGGFKATGRNKPASEYLAEARRRGEWPSIYNVVDINNLLSLETGWPMSVLDAGKCGTPLEVRFGRTDERYVFNQAGHAIDLEGLLGLGRVDGPMLGNPVKDAVHAKVDPDTTRLVTALWASRDVATPEQVLAVATDFGELLGRWAGTTRWAVAVRHA
ncbi:MAG: phenylalanine--tRNA ligase beta subunit-related protein [Myxococcota bacterium]